MEKARRNRIQTTYGRSKWPWIRGRVCPPSQVVKRRCRCRLYYRSCKRNIKEFPSESFPFKYEVRSSSGTEGEWEVLKRIEKVWNSLKKVGWSLLDKVVLGLTCSGEEPVTFGYCGNIVFPQVVRYSPTIPSHSGVGWRRLCLGSFRAGVLSGWWDRKRKKCKGICNKGVVMMNNDV